jgi:hypothetical protein
MIQLMNMGYSMGFHLLPAIITINLRCHSPVARFFRDVHTAASAPVCFVRICADLKWTHALTFIHLYVLLYSSTHLLIPGKYSVSKRKQTSEQQASLETQASARAALAGDDLALQAASQPEPKQQRNTRTKKCDCPIGFLASSGVHTNIVIISATSFSIDDAFHKHTLRPKRGNSTGISI